MSTYVLFDSENGGELAKIHAEIMELKNAETGLVVFLNSARDTIAVVNLSPGQSVAKLVS